MNEFPPQRPPEGRVPPHDLVAERAVLGGMMLDGTAADAVIATLEPEHFYHESHRVIFEASKAIVSNHQPVDYVTLRDELARRSKLAAVGGDEYLVALTDTIPSLKNIESHAKIVRDKSMVRDLLNACHEVAATGYGDYGPTREFLDFAESTVFKATHDPSSSSYEPLRALMMGVFSAIAEAAKRGDELTGLSTGFTEIDKMTAGMHPGNLIVIAGRPAMGKTAFSLCVAVNAAKAANAGQLDVNADPKEQKAVAVFSLEMAKDELVKRLLSSEGRIHAGRLRNNQLNEEDWTTLAQTSGALSNLPMYIDDTPALSVLELRSRCRRLKAEANLALVVVDYLQLMRSGSKNDSREQEISTISRALKALAKELEIPVIALSQLNRGVESRTDKRPMLSDLRESGAIEQDADTIWFVYRDEVYNPETQDRGVAEVIVGKQRAGRTGTARLRFVGEFTRFDNLESRRDDEFGGPPAGGGNEFSDG